MPSINCNTTPSRAFVQGGEEPVGEAMSAVRGVRADQFDLYDREPHLAVPQLLSDRDQARHRPPGRDLLRDEEVGGGDGRVPVEEIPGPGTDPGMRLAPRRPLKVDRRVDRGELVDVGGPPGADFVMTGRRSHNLHI
jgi:hypothetical protein